MEKFEKLGDFKKAVKTLVRGAVKAGLGADGKYVFTVTKNDDKTIKTVTIAATSGAFTLTLAGDVVTRVYNKVDAAFFEPIKAQFEKLAKVESISFKM